jgi:hypothetical protein
MRDKEFKTALELYKNHKGRPKGSKNPTTLLLDYRTWTIEYDGSGFPSTTFNLRKKGSKHTAYCSTLESALKILYNEMLVDYVNRKSNYGAKFGDLANAIVAAKKEIIELIGADGINKFLKNNRAENNKVGL